jgi:anti-sigma factor RsiW
MERQDFMGCEDVRDLLPLYVGGEASGDDQRAVEEHVRLCGACARELDQYREARAQLALLREGEAPAALWRSLWAGVRSELFPPSTSGPGASWVEMSLRCAAALFLGMAIGLVAHLASGGGGAAPREAAPAPRDAREFVNVSARGSGPARVLSAEPSPWLRAPVPRFEAFLPEAALEEDAYLPRVESLLPSDEREF